MKRYFIVALVLYIQCNIFAASSHVLSWDLMSKLDSETGNMPSELAQLNQQMVEITGFIVPLELDDSIDSVKEFLLVPDPLACIHVPPPPVNQMVYVIMNKSIPLDMDLRGVILEGILTIYKEDDDLFSYELAGKKATEANIEFEDSFDEIWGY
ncbi:hypothetical protein DID76_04495 [Candidatus Marinamargulisbacteria bacterium SCGC AG-414-C22]|nr:hypothetical protein DID76_04495 [Candidatus Marinamargulisbacteria bacterium SCGC AG-414-C22]